MEENVKKRNEDKCKEQRRKDVQDKVDHKSSKKTTDIRTRFKTSRIEYSKETK